MVLMGLDVNLNNTFLFNIDSAFPVVKWGDVGNCM